MKIEEILAEGTILYKLHSQGLINSKKENYVKCQLSNNASYQSILVYQCNHDHNSDQIARKNTCRKHIKQTKFKRKTVYIPDYQRFTYKCMTYDHFNES